MIERDCCLGIDTSCYTTSVACVNANGIVFSERTMLSVPFGGRGLRQSEGLFQHVKQLPPLIEHLFEQVNRERIGVVAVSAKPVDEENSYMPVFLAGLGLARSLAAALGVPLIETHHQAGHLRAALVGNESLIGQPIYGFHISGGTTDLMTAETCLDRPYMIRQVGTSTDLHAGQFVDRVGVKLGLPFPAGKHLEQLAQNAVERNVKLAAAVRNGSCSFSGAEAAAMRIYGTVPDTELAYGVYDCLARTITKMLRFAEEQNGKRPVLICGGVASSALLRKMLQERYGQGIYWGKQELSADNAVGVAYIGWERSSLWNS